MVPANSAPCSNIYNSLCTGKLYRYCLGSRDISDVTAAPACPAPHSCSPTSESGGAVTLMDSGVESSNSENINR